MADDPSGGVRRTPGYCAMCWSSCGCTMVVEDGRLAAVEPDPDHPTGKALCAKGRAAPDYVYNDQRLTHPLKRTRPKSDPDPGWERISWDEALATVAAEMQRIANDHGSEAVAFNITTSAGTSMQDGYVWAERLRHAFGSPNVVASIELCNFTQAYVYPHTFGDSMPMPDLDNAGCIVLWGHNPAVAWLAHGTRVADARARGAKLVVVDPRRAGLANKADEWLRVRPGTDGALALGIAGIMIEEGLFDREFVATWTNGPHLVRDDTGELLRGDEIDAAAGEESRVAWDTGRGEPVIYDPASRSYEASEAGLALDGSFDVPGVGGKPIRCRPVFALYAALCADYPPERVEALTWVPAAQIRATARLIGNSEAVSLFSWSGLEQHANASQNSRAVALLYALTGCIDAPGGNVWFEMPPAQSVMGDEMLPPSLRRKTLGVDQRPLGPEAIYAWIPTEALYDAVLEGTPYPVRGLVSFGSNVLLSHADGGRGAAALEALEFMVHTDLFMTPTAAHADIVLPVNTPWEREGLRVGFGVDQAAVSHVQLRPAAVEPLGESRSDVEIVFALAERLGLGNRFWDGDIDAGYQEVLGTTGLTVDALRAAPRGITVPLETRYRKYADARETGGAAPAQGFGTPSGKVELFSETFQKHGYAPLPDYTPPPVGPEARPDLAERFPLVLMSAKTPRYLGSQGRSVHALRRKEAEPRVEIHPETAAARGIAEGDAIDLTTPHGAMRAVARFSPSLHPGVVSATHGWWQSAPRLDLPGYDALSKTGANYNAVIGGDVVDPVGGNVPLRSYLCEVALAGP